MDASLKFTQQDAENILSKIKAFDFNMIEKIRKAKDDNGTFDVIISSDAVDRSGEIVRQDGWDFSNYKKNPIVLWGHDYYSLPIGVCTNIAVEGNKTRAQGVFLSADINPFAQQVRRLYDYGMKNGQGVGCTTSVGFIPKDFDNTNQKIITKQELLEFSFVPIPAQADVGAAKHLTIDMAKEIGLDVFAMRTKGVLFNESKKKDAQLGDTCQLDDGSPGILATDPNDADGPLVCVPSTQDKSEQNDSGDEPNMEQTQDKLMKAVDAEHTRHKGAYKKSIEDFKAAVAAMKKAKKPKDEDKTIDISKCMKSLRSALADEHDMHKSKMIECFRSFQPSDEKAFDNADHLKAVRDQHKAYTGNVNAEMDKFEEKSKAAEPSTMDNAADAVAGKLATHQAKHMKSIAKIAKGMCKAAFGEGETTGDDKAWYLKGAVEDQLAEDQNRQMKWKKVDKVYNVFGAFIETYLNDTTPVSDFEKLLDEAVALMKTADEKGMIGKTEIEGKAEIVFRVGSKICTTTKDKLSEARQNLQSAMAVLKDFSEALDDDDEEEAGSADVDGDEGEGSHEPGSKSHASSNASDGLQAQLKIREIVRGIEAVARESLGKINADIRDRRNGKK